MFSKKLTMHKQRMRRLKSRIRARGYNLKEVKDTITKEVEKRI